MKENSKKISAIILAAMLALALAACSGGGNNEKDSKFVGTWKATIVEANGVSVNPADADAEMTVVFKADGNATINMTGEEPMDFKWKEKDGGVELDDGAETIVGKMDGEKLVIDLSAQGVKFHLEKQ